MAFLGRLVREESGGPEREGPVVGAMPFVYLGKGALLEVTSSMASGGGFGIGDPMGLSVCAGGHHS